MALALSGTSNGSLNNLSLSGNTATIVDTGKAGTIVQVVQSIYSTQVASTTNVLADTGLSATITPTSSSNKILVMFSQAGLQKNTSNTGVVLRLFRGTTQILDIAYNTGFTNSTATNRVGTASSMKLDSPATTSAVTYKTQFSSVGGGTGVYVQVDNDDSVMTLLEVVA